MASRRGKVRRRKRSATSSSGIDGSKRLIPTVISSSPLNVDSISLRKYLREIGTHAETGSLPPEEVNALIALSRGPDPAAALGARNRLMTSMLRLVVEIAKAYQGREAPLADLIQEGNIGLLRAIEKFDPARGIRLTTYAVWWVHAGIILYLGNSGLIRVPAKPYHAARYLIRLKASLQQALGRIPTQEELRQAMEDGPGLYRSSYDAAITAQATHSVMSLDAPISLRTRGGSGDGGQSSSGPDLTLAGTIAAPDLLDTAVQTAQEILAVASLLPYLPPMEEVVIRVVYGIGTKDEATESMKAVGDLFGVSRERARQVVEQALATLQQVALRRKRGLIPFRLRRDPEDATAVSRWFGIRCGRCLRPLTAGAEAPVASFCTRLCARVWWVAQRPGNAARLEEAGRRAQERRQAQRRRQQRRMPIPVSPAEEAGGDDSGERG